VGGVRGGGLGLLFGVCWFGLGFVGGVGFVSGVWWGLAFWSEGLFGGGFGVGGVLSAGSFQSELWKPASKIT